MNAEPCLAIAIINGYPRQSRENFDRVPSHTEAAAMEINIISAVLDVDQAT